MEQDQELSAYPSSIKENGLDWYYGEENAVGYFSFGRMYTAMKKYAISRPNEVKIRKTNSDGSILVEFPVDWIKVRPPKKITSEARSKLCDNLQK